MKTIICIEGQIGVGKTTLAEYLNGIYESQILYEPVEKWTSIRDENGQNLLSCFYANPKKYAYLFQSAVYISKLTNMVDMLNYGNKKIIFVDRSLDADKNIFAKYLKDNQYMNELEWTIYNQWNDFYKKNINAKKYTIYLRCNPEIALQRIRQRGRIEESEIKLEYLQSIHNYHESWLNTDTLPNTLIIDWNDFSKRNLSELQGFISNAISNA